MISDDGGLTGPELIPLTRKQRNGEVLVRNPAVEAEIRSMLQQSPAEIRRRASIQAEDDGDFITAECLVYLIREMYRRDEEAMVSALWAAITARVSPNVESKLRTLSASYHEEGVSAVIRNMGLVIFDFDTDRGDFYQVSFWTTIQRRTIDEFRRQVRLNKKDRKFTSLEAQSAKGAYSTESDDDGDAAETEDWASESMTPLEELEHQELVVEDTIRIEVALSSLREIVRQAFLLRNEGWQIESKDPNEETISTMLKRTPRQIRNYLKEADQRLNSRREEDQ